MLPRHSMNRATASARSELRRGRQESQPRRLHCDDGSGQTRPCAHSIVIRVKRACSGLDVFLPKGSCVKSLVPSTAILGSEAEPQGVRPSGKSFGIPGPWSFLFPFPSASWSRGGPCFATFSLPSPNGTLTGGSRQWVIRCWIGTSYIACQDKSFFP